MAHPRDPIDPKVTPTYTERVVERGGMGAGVLMLAILALAVVAMIWMFAGPNRPVQTTAQIEAPAKVELTVPEKKTITVVEPEKVQPAQPAQPEQPPPPANNTTQP